VGVSHVFGHRHLAAYEKAVEFYGWIAGMERRFARADPCLAERLRLVASGISMAIARGAGATERGRKAIRYRAALGAVTECAAILDLFAATHRPDANLDYGRTLLEEIATHVGALVLHATREAAPRPAERSKPRR
jgi:hypothetical protein